ncbi:MAG: hypothetical protein ACLUPL_08115 [Butyricimonas virosa]
MFQFNTDRLYNSSDGGVDGIRESDLEWQNQYQSNFGLISVTQKTVFVQFNYYLKKTRIVDYDYCGSFSVSSISIRRI